MRTLRNRTVGILAVLVVMVWAGAASASTISMVWISTNGGGAGVGTSSLTNVSVSDTAVLEIRWTVATPAGPGIQGMGIRAQYDPTVILATFNDPCPLTANNAFGGGGSPSCGAFATAIGGVSGFLPILTTTTNDLGVGPQGASTGAAGGTVPNAGQANGSFWELARITFHATGPGTTGGFFFKTGIDGQVPIGGGFSFPAGPVSGFTITVIPEPATFAMLALGLGALAFAGRRRR